MTWGLIGRVSKWLVAAAWCTGVVVPMGYFAGWHLLTLPRPDKALVAPTLSHQPDGRPAWRTFHVLGEGCKCSANILTHLIERGALPGVVETIYFVGTADKHLLQAQERGFAVMSMTSEQLFAQHKIEAVPLFIVVNEADEVVYAGGYAERKQGAAILDVALLEKATAGHPLEELPLFGCAIGRELQRQIDPLGLKYASAVEALQ